MFQALPSFPLLGFPLLTVSDGKLGGDYCKLGGDYCKLGGDYCKLGGDYCKLGRA